MTIGIVVYKTIDWDFINKYRQDNEVIIFDAFSIKNKENNINEEDQKKLIKESMRYLRFNEDKKLYSFSWTRDFGLFVGVCDFVIYDNRDLKNKTI